MRSCSKGGRDGGEEKITNKEPGEKRIREERVGKEERCRRRIRLRIKENERE